MKISPVGWERVDQCHSHEVSSMETWYIKRRIRIQRGFSIWIKMVSLTCKAGDNVLIIIAEDLHVRKGYATL